MEKGWNGMEWNIGAYLIYNNLQTIEQKFKKCQY